MNFPVFRVFDYVVLIFQDFLSQETPVFMKLFIIFFLLFSVPHGYSQSVDSSGSLSSEKALTLLRGQLKRYVDSLMLVLLDEDTPRENQLEILEEIRTIADINGQITIALNQISQNDIGQNGVNINKDRDEDISVWAKNQAELIRRKQSALNELERREKELDEEFWVNLALDGVVIVAGGVLFFVPAVGPAISIPLTVGRITHITLTGRKLGALLMGTGVIESGLDIWNYLFEEEEDSRVPSLLSDIVFRDMLTKELFGILSSPNQSDRYLAINLLRSASVDEETLTNDLLNVIRDEKRSIEVRRSALRALKAIPIDKNEGLREEVTDVLKEIIDGSQVPALRQTAINVLGKMGEGVSEVAEYLEKKGIEAGENDELRLTALIELGRNRDYFLISIKKLAKWLEGRNYNEKPLNIQPEIPDFFSDFFLDSLLLVEQEQLSKDHVIVVKEFILSGILNAALKVRFSETLLGWDDSSENKALLRAAYSNPVKDIRLYVENDLFKEGLSEENYGAFQFLQSRTGSLEKIEDFKRILQEIELIIKELKKLYPNQLETAEKMEEVVNSYKKMLESVKN